jgi:hypothetical protein
VTRFCNPADISCEPQLFRWREIALGVQLGILKYSDVVQIALERITDIPRQGDTAHDHRAMDRSPDPRKHRWTEKET